MIAPKVMVVEDEEPLGVLLKYNLEAEGYQVEVIPRGDEAEIRLQENVPDLLVLDWMVPAISGIELCRRLRMRPETQRLPVIMLTARGEESDRVRGLSTGADDYLVKPFSTPEFLARVKALLRRAKPEVLSSVLKVGEIVLDREVTPRLSQEERVEAWPHRVPAARIYDAPPRPRLLAHATAGQCLGRDELYRRAHCRRPCRASAQGGQHQPHAGCHPHHSRCGLCDKGRVVQRHI